MEVYVTKQLSLTPSNMKYFKDNGYLVLRDALCEKELDSLRQDTNHLIGKMREDATNEDYWFNDEIPSNWYKKDHVGQDRYYTKPSMDVKRGIPFRLEYPIDKSVACKRLMGHPFVLRAIEQLLGTVNFIPTWDSLVFKQEGEGVPIKWHRDASAESVDNQYPAIDVGYYLDEANVQMDNCLWVIPASHKWDDSFAAMMIDFLSQDGFKKTGAIPVSVKPGDVILHNILVIHGSASCKSPLRRTVYYEYRAIEQELRRGPHIPSYIPLKQSMVEDFGIIVSLLTRKASFFPL
eukprot:TRINITY_DN10061_c0_g2_i10.p1 TRINITY_DN10061_c0_g2~~TRINITY_DN10061_c0_g2_i10.p1  ORF type:complete len:324 (-),score=54.76 TRINITY_DN10061_c0_g2_i10:256-1131(-)